MDSKTTIKTNPGFEHYEQNAMLQYLRRMADEGWILKKADTSFIFEKGSGEKVFYAINFYNPSSGNIEDFLKNYSEKGYEDLGVYSSNYIFSSSEINGDINDIERETNFKVLRKNIAGKILWFLISVPTIFIGLSQGASEIWYSNTILIFLSFLLLAGSKEFLDFLWTCRYLIRERTLIRHGYETDDFLFEKYKKRKASLKITPVILMTIWMSLGLTAATEQTGQIMGIIVFATFLFALISLLTNGKIGDEKIFGREPDIYLKVIKNISIILCIAGLLYILVMDVRVYYQNQLYEEDDMTSYVNKNETPKTIKLESVFGENNQGILILEDENGGNSQRISYSLFESRYDFVIKHTFQTSKYELYEAADPKDWGAQDYKKVNSIPTYPRIVLYPSKVFEYSTRGYEPDIETINLIREYLDLE